MGSAETCARCGGAVAVGDGATWSVTASPEALRAQGWVGFEAADGREAVHVGCLGWAEADALFGGSRGPQADVTLAEERTGRFTRGVPAQA